MMNKATKEDGFTLIEMLLVLAVTGILAIAAVHFYVQKADYQTQSFFRQFQMDMHYLQSYAMANERSVWLNFVNNGTQYFAKDSMGERVLMRKMPDGYRYNTENKFRLNYLSNGNVIDFGSLTFYTPDGQKQLYVYIGKGRMYLVE